MPAPPAPPAPAVPQVVRPIDVATHRAFVEEQAAAGRHVSFLQTPGWGQVKLNASWRAVSIGWFDAADRLVGSALVLHRMIPKQQRWSLAYVPEGPVLAWDGEDLRAWLDPFVAWARREHCFGIRMGPPVVTATWDAPSVKQGVADDDVRRLTDLPPSDRPPAGALVVSQLRELGWRSQATEDGFGSGQPQYNFEVPLEGGADAVLKAMNQQWRRNIKKADKSGVEVASVAPGSPEALADPAALEATISAFHALYEHTAERDGFTPRPLSYFQTMAARLGEDDPDRIRFWTGHHEGDLVASTITIRVGRRVWYAYGASSTEKRDVRGSNALQWAMMRYAIDLGCDVYDLRGITPTLDADDSHVGLIQFKVGTGGRAVEYAGEWDLPLNRPLYKAFDLYMSRR